MNYILKYHMISWGTKVPDVPGSDSDRGSESRQSRYSSHPNCSPGPGPGVGREPRRAPRSRLTWRPHTQLSRQCNSVT